MGFHLVSTLEQATKRTVDEVSREIESEMKGIVSGKHTKSGAALAAIHIEQTGDMSRFVGGTGGEGTKHLYYLNEGNGGRGRIITANHRRKDGRPGALGKKPDGIPGYGWKQSVHGYDGIHFVEEIAARHGG